MKKFYTVVFTLVCLFVLSACGNNEGDQVTANSDESKKYVLKFTSPAPDQGVFTRANDALAKYIEEKSEGRITFERYYGGSLVKPGDELDSLSSGIIDMAVFTNSYVPGKLPLSTITTTTSLWEDVWVGSKAFDELYKQNKNLTDEVEQYGVKHLGNYSLPGSYMLSTKKIESLEDLKGMTVVANGQVANLARALGANAVSVPVEDLYETISKGTADAVFYGTVEGVTFGLTGEIKYIYQIPIGSVAGMVAINQNTFNSLPEDLQAILTEAVSEQYPMILHEIFQVEGAGNTLQELIDAGAEIVEPSKEDYDKVVSIAKESVWSQWEKQMEKDGHDVGDLLENLQSLIKKYEGDSENPNN